MGLAGIWMARGGARAPDMRARRLVCDVGEGRTVEGGGRELRSAVRRGEGGWRGKASTGSIVGSAIWRAEVTLESRRGGSKKDIRNAGGWTEAASQGEAAAGGRRRVSLEVSGRSEGREEEEEDEDEEDEDEDEDDEDDAERSRGRSEK